MSTIATTPYAGSTPGSSGAAGPANELGKDAFLKLLVIQLQNQDPLQPVDNQAFIAQLAQFSSVEQLQGLGSRLDTLLLAQASANQIGTAGLVGKDVLYRADGVDLSPGRPAAGEVQLSAAADVTVAVQDASGRTVRTLTLGVHDAGAVPIGWDGLDDAGKALPAGHYTFVVSARDAQGAAVAVETRVRGLVQGVSFDADGTTLLVGGARVKLSDVIQINQA